MPQTKPVISVENVVASASVDQKIDLIEVTKKHPKTEYHPEQFPGLVQIGIYNHGIIRSRWHWSKIRNDGHQIL